MDQLDSSTTILKEFKAKPPSQRTVISGTKKQAQSKFDSPLLQAKIKKYLPVNYNFEILKILNRIDQLKAKRICLQFPEGKF